MRTTLDLDDTVLAAARAMAANRRISLGAAVSELAKQGLSASSAGGVRAEFSYSPFPVMVGDDGVVVTPELVNALRDA